MMEEILIERKEMTVVSTSLVKVCLVQFLYYLFACLFVFACCFFVLLLVCLYVVIQSLVPPLLPNICKGYLLLAMGGERNFFLQS